MANKLNSKRLIFIEEYLSNGNNATQAYQKVYPKAKNSTCKTNGCLWLQESLVKREIQKIKYKASLRASITVERQLKRLDEIVDESINEKDRQNAIKGLQEQNKLLGLYEFNHLNSLNPEAIPNYDLSRLSPEELQTLQSVLNKAYIGDEQLENND